jgi:hypothetical protein
MNQRLDYPATSRNKDAIKEVLTKYLPHKGRVLEIASGSGQHISFFAQEFSDLEWIPTDIDPAGRASVDAWIAHEKLLNVQPCLDLDVTKPSWPVEKLQFLYCANMIHIAPWEACLGLFSGAAQSLEDNAHLFLYGPFIIEDIPTALSNLQFDASLKNRNPTWGIRNLKDVKSVAEENGFQFLDWIAMPANNYCVIFQKTNADS